MSEQTKHKTHGVISLRLTVIQEAGQAAAKLQPQSSAPKMLELAWTEYKANHPERV